MSKKKEAIMAAALKLFSEKGFRATSVAELSAITHAAEGTIFHHFKNKEDLFLHCLARIKEDILEEYSRYSQNRQPATGMEWLEEAIGFYLYLAATREHHFLLLHRRYPYQLAEQNTACWENLKAIYDCLVDIFEEAIAAGRQDGSIGPVPTRKSALLVFTMVDGLVRFKNYQLYDAATLYPEWIAACKRMLQPRTGTSV